MDEKTFRYALEPDDLVRLTAWRDRTFFLGSHLVVVVLIFCCAGFMGWIAIVSRKAAIGYAIFLLALWIFHRIRRGPYRNVKRSIEQMAPRVRAVVFGPATVVVDEAGVRRNAALSEFFRRWEVVEHVYEAREGIFFTFATAPHNARLYLPARLFASPGQMKEFHAFCQQRVTAARAGFETARPALPVNADEGPVASAPALPRYKPPPSPRRLAFDLLLLLLFLVLFLGASLGWFKG
jgi:hypothetical protein